MQHAMKLLARVAHILLVLFLSSLLIYSVYYAFALLGKEQQQGSQQSVQEGNYEESANDLSRKPSPQEIAASMNTMWDYLDDWDEEHCKNVCEASWVACRLRNCYHLPDVRKQEL